MHSPSHICVALLTFHHGAAEVAGLGAAAVAIVMQVVLELLKAGSGGQTGVPLWILANPVKHCPLHLLVTPFTKYCGVTQIAWAVASIHPSHAEHILEFLETGMVRQSLVPLWVQDDAVMLRPEHCMIALLAFHCGGTILLIAVVCAAWCRRCCTWCVCCVLCI